MKDEYWERILGAPINDRLDKAADQIRATRTFVPGPLRGGVLIVNAAGPSLDWKSFSHLTNRFALRFPAIDAIFAMNGVPLEIDQGSQLHFATIGRSEHHEAADKLGQELGAAIVAEISQRTGKLCESTELDPNTPYEKVVFTYTRSGLRLKNLASQSSRDGAEVD